IVVPDDLVEAGDAAELLRAELERSTGAHLPIQANAEGRTAFRFDIGSDDASPESYTLEVGDTEVRFSAADHDGFIWAVQTFRHLLDPAVFGAEPRSETFTVPGVRIVDAPRYSWRGAMLDITRHWFEPADIRSFIDQISLYKINRLHL